jgi:hypothetical protein
MNTTTESTDQKRIEVVVGIVVAVAETIKELGSVPSGHLYARLMGHMNLETYENIIGVLVRKGLVRHEPSHLLVWTGDALQSKAAPTGSVGCK